MRAAMIVVVGVGTVGCASLKVPPRMEGVSAETAPTGGWTSDDCRGWDNGFGTWGGAAKVSAVLAGTGGVTAAFPSGQGDRVALGLTSAVLAAFTALAAFVSDNNATNFTKRCNNDGTPIHPKTETGPANGPPPAGPPPANPPPANPPPANPPPGPTR